MTKTRTGTATQDRLRDEGRAATYATGVGISDRDALQAAMGEAVPSGVLLWRSAWLVGHEMAVRDLDSRARDAAADHLAAVLTAAGVAVSAPRAGSMTVTIGDVAFRVCVTGGTRATPREG